MSDVTDMAGEGVEAWQQGVVEQALWGLAHEPQIHYAEVRPIDGLHRPHKLPLSVDCSGFATLCYKWAGAPDPNGNGYSGQGYTGTLLRHMRHIPKAHARPGDLVVFGPGAGHHVVVLASEGADPQVISHGSETGPKRLLLSVESRYQPAPVTFLTLRGVTLAEDPGEPATDNDTNPPADPE